MLSHMLSPLMPNARELVERAKPWLFDEDSATDIALLHAVAALGSMREAELALYLRGDLQKLDSCEDQLNFAVTYPAVHGNSTITVESALHATRRRLLLLVKAGLLAAGNVARTTSDNLHGPYYWLTRKGSSRLKEAGYRVRDRQYIDNMTHIGTVQDQHRVLEQQYLIARRLMNPSLRVWGEYSIRSRLARHPTPAGKGTKPPSAQELLGKMGAELFVTSPAASGKGKPGSMSERRNFKRWPDALVFDEQPERERYLNATCGLNASRPPHTFGDIDWIEAEASKKDAATQAVSLSGLFYVGFMLDDTLERGRIARVVLVSRNHPHADLRTKLLKAYEAWLQRADVMAMLKKKAILTPGFDAARPHVYLSLAELTQDSEHRLTSLRMESFESIFAREGRGGSL